MISWGDVYKVGAAMVPLYVPLLLGFWSVRRWHIFTPEQCEAVNRLVAFFGCPSSRSGSRLQMSLPIIIENSIAIMARCGNGLAMFSMGLFMAQQDNLIPCGAGLTFLGLVLKFVLGPIAMTIGSIAVGLRGDVVRVAIIQAAVPQSITSFIFAKEYGLHPDVLSTA
ncbi:hypothetical protein PR202_gb24528 [Eleusine coracana subsp. coracana]|uniref:Uncharacterized protein n=1 Tax=Eleusine coracana subsp. coracana TaxID=191504 RepID=A0AAV5FMM3_ELECO|nr:hypothetical protein PR202_gb24528 [Eleusine coracana subsp. coracana]